MDAGSLHWRQPRRGCRGHIPQYFGWGDVNGNIPQYYNVLSDTAEQYWLPSVRSASSRFHSAIRRHQFASVRQADSRLTRFVPSILNSCWRHWFFVLFFSRQAAAAKQCTQAGLSSASVYRYFFYFYLTISGRPTISILPDWPATNSHGWQKYGCT